MAFPQKALVPKNAGRVGFFKFLINHWYFFLFVFSIIPGLITSIQIAKETNNPAYPVIHTSLSMANADAELYDTVYILETDPTKIIGMEKPDVGIWFHFKYYLKVFLVIWKIVGDLVLIMFPFVVLYKLYNWGNTSAKIGSIRKAIITGTVVMLVINLIIVIVNLVSETANYTFKEGWDIYQKVGYILYLNLPLHGVIELVKFIIISL